MIKTFHTIDDVFSTQMFHLKSFEGQSYRDMINRDLSCYIYKNICDQLQRKFKFNDMECMRFIYKQTCPELKSGLFSNEYNAFYVLKDFIIDQNELNKVLILDYESEESTYHKDTARENSIKSKNFKMIDHFDEFIALFDAYHQLQSKEIYYLIKYVIEYENEISSQSSSVIFEELCRHKNFDVNVVDTIIGPDYSSGSEHEFSVTARLDKQKNYRDLLKVAINKQKFHFITRLCDMGHPINDYHINHSQANCDIQLYLIGKQSQEMDNDHASSI